MTRVEPFASSILALSVRVGLAFVVWGAQVSVSHAFGNCQMRLAGRSLGTVEVVRQQAVNRISARDLYGNEANTAVRRSRKRQSRRRRASSGLLIRRIPSLWWMKIPRNVDPASLVVTHDSSAGGAQDAAVAAMVSLEDSADRLPFFVRAERPVVVCRNATHQIVEGGVTLEINVQRAPPAGRYHVLIETRVARR